VALLFLVEGLATLLLGVVYLLWLPAGRPRPAGCPEEEGDVSARLEAERPP